MGLLSMVLGAILGGDSTPPPGVDPLVGKAAQANADLGKEQLAFSKQQYADQQGYLAKLQPYIDSYMKSNSDSMALVGKQNAQSAEDYQNLWRPEQLAYLKDVNAAGTPEQMESAATTAGAGVQSQMDMQREATARDQASMGVSPDSGSAMVTGRVGGVLGSAAKAGAMNSARLSERDRGTAMRAGAVGVGMGNANMALQGVQVGNQTAQSGAGVGATPFNLNGAAGTQFSAGLGSAGNLNQSSGDIALGGGRLALSGWQAGQAANAQQWQGIGSIARLGIQAYGAGMFGSTPTNPTSDETLKEDKRPISGRALVNAVKSMRIERWKYKPGVADEGEHIGTYAQDFADATGVGDGRTISIIDAIGVIQGALKETIRTVEGLSRGPAMAGVR